MEPPTFRESDSNVPQPAPDYRVVNYQVSNTELTGAIKKALGDTGNPSARVFVGKSPEREGWAIRCLIVEGGPKSQIKLVMYPSGTNGTHLVTQKRRVMTWVRLEILLEQVQKWLGGDARISLMFNWLKITGIDDQPEHVESENLGRDLGSKVIDLESEAIDK